MAVNLVHVEMEQDVLLRFISKENNKKNILLTTSAGELNSEILGDNLVETGIGIGKTKWDEIPLSQNINTKNLGITITDNNGDMTYFGRNSHKCWKSSCGIFC